MGLGLELGAVVGSPKAAVSTIEISAEKMLGNIRIDFWQHKSPLCPKTMHQPGGLHKPQVYFLLSEKIGIKRLSGAVLL